MSPMLPSWIRSSKGNPRRGSPVPLGDRDDELEVLLDEPPPRATVAGLRPPREIHLLPAGQERAPADALQVPRQQLRRLRLLAPACLPAARFRAGASGNARPRATSTSPTSAISDRKRGRPHPSGVPSRRPEANLARAKSPRVL
jgi:hypothetical protein